MACTKEEENKLKEDNLGKVVGGKEQLADSTKEQENTKFSASVEDVVKAK